MVLPIQLKPKTTIAAMQNIKRKKTAAAGAGAGTTFNPRGAPAADPRTTPPPGMAPQPGSGAARTGAGSIGAAGQPGSRVSMAAGASRLAGVSSTRDPLRGPETRDNAVGGVGAAPGSTSWNPLVQTTTGQTSAQGGYPARTESHGQWRGDGGRSVSTHEEWREGGREPYSGEGYWRGTPSPPEQERVRGDVQPGGYGLPGPATWAPNTISYTPPGDGLSSEREGQFHGSANAEENEMLRNMSRARAGAAMTSDRLRGFGSKGAGFDPRPGTAEADPSESEAPQGSTGRPAGGGVATSGQGLTTQETDEAAQQDEAAAGGEPAKDGGPRLREGGGMDPGNMENAARTLGVPTEVLQGLLDGGYIVSYNTDGTWSYWHEDGGEAWGSSGGLGDDTPLGALMTAARKRHDEETAQTEREHGQAQADQFIAGLPDVPQLDQGAIDQQVRAMQKRQAFEQSRAMRAQMEMASRSGVSPSAQIGLETEVAHRAGVAGAEQEGNIRSQAALRNFQAQIQHYQTQAQALFMAAQFEQDITTRQALFRQAQAMLGQQTRAQEALLRLQNQLNSVGFGEAALGALGRIGGDAITLGLSRIV